MEMFSKVDLAALDDGPYPFKSTDHGQAELGPVSLALENVQKGVYNWKLAVARGFICYMCMLALMRLLELGGQSGCLGGPGPTCSTIS